MKMRLVANLSIFFTGKTRSSFHVLNEQRNNIENRLAELRKLKDMAYIAKEYLLKGELDKIGFLLHESWKEKKKLASNITNYEIDNLYEKAIDSGAIGGKIAGAGAGGFLLLYCPMEKQNSLRNALNGYRELPFLLSRDGSKVIFNIRGYEWK
ncbi:MAG: D-glycero-alpha-D-manno-heptose 7-phosphate kinase [candidate division WS2 bacterium]|nr:D-glycero-alpha-D-manno-heptose 7-phosphate kinase [Candidatus Lithacetigena glycinireducens]